MKILVTICGRGGSKGIPGKNVKILNGKPLLGYSINHAKDFASTHQEVDIVLSTDDDNIRAVAVEHGLTTDYTRPDHLANDTVGKIQVIRDVLKYQERKQGKEYDVLLDLDITSPLRTLEDLNLGLKKLTDNADALNIFSVSKPHKNPYFNVVEVGEDGYCTLVKKSDALSRQTAPKVYDMNASFYFYRRRFFDLGMESTITEKSLIFVMEHPCFDLDEPLDFDVMEYLLTNDKLGIRI